MVAADDPYDPAALSRRFGEVQRFVTHRVVDLHGWQRWVDGHPVRRFEYLGESDETLFDEGELTEAEESEDLEVPDEETVMTIAAAWSVDPTTLDDRDDVPGEVLVGRLSSGAGR